MSEEKEKKMSVEVTVSRDPEIEALNEKLAQKEIESQEQNNRISELEGDLTTIAEQRLNEKTRQYDINPNLSEEQKIAKIKEIERKSSDEQSSRALWGNQNANQIIDNDEDYDDVESMILDLNRKAKSNDAVESVESQAVLRELTKKALKKPLNIELESPLRTMARRPRMLETEKQADFQKRLDDWKKTQKWKHIGDD